MRLSRQLIALSSLLLSILAGAQEIGGNPTPGGVALVPIFDLEKPSIRFGLKQVAVLNDLSEHGIWLGLVGIDLLTAPGTYLLSKKHSINEQDEQPIHLVVHPKEQSLHPSTTMTSRIEEYLSDDLNESRDSRSLHELVGDWQTEQFFSLPFIKPLQGGSIEQDAFGVHVRYPNGQMEPINTLIFRTNGTDAQIVTPSSGIIHKILLPENLETDTVISINHGQGVFSLLMGEFELQVGTGDTVESGQVIAYFTDEDSVLSWQLILNGDVVDPNQFVDIKLDDYFRQLTLEAKSYYALLAEQRVEADTEAVLENINTAPNRRDEDQPENNDN